ncbi:MAG: hypothetical protein ACPGUV_09910, partial [Polyangiales bacterium]
MTLPLSDATPAFAAQGAPAEARTAGSGASSKAAEAGRAFETLLIQQLVRVLRQTETVVWLQGQVQ